MDARTIVRADALFEAALGLAILCGAASGALGPRDFPHPVGTAVIAAAGCLLLPVAAVLWRGMISLTALAATNAVVALGTLIWLIAASGFSAAGTSVIAVTVITLAGLAAAQVAAHQSSARPI